VVEERQAHPAQAKRGNRTHNPMYQRNLNNAFATAAYWEYHTPIGAIAEAALLAQQLPPDPQIQRLQCLTQRTLVQLDGQHQVSSTRNLPSRSEHHGDTAQISCTPRGGPVNRRNDNHQCNKGHQSTRGNIEQEVQQSTHQHRNQCDTRPQIQAPPEASLHDTPTIDLRQQINDGHDAQHIIGARRRDRRDKYHNNNDNNCFPAFTPNIIEKSYPKDFKPVEIPKYDGKQDPGQWIRCYSVAIMVSGGSNSTKALYFLVALESPPLTWLQSLKLNSINSWEDLKRAFIDNFQGSMIRAGTHHDLSQVK
jgi:hypothetical protein